MCGALCSRTFEAAPVPVVSERHIGILPSGKYRVRIKSGDTTLAATFRDVEQARTQRDAWLQALADGSVVHRRDLVGRSHQVCGINPIRIWPVVSGIYFAAVPSIAQVKIGFAKVSIRQRLSDLACGAPRLVLLGWTSGAREDEQRLHETFAAYRSTREWFHLEGALLEYVRRIRRSK